MNRDKIIDTVGTIGKVAVRSVAYVGTSIAVCGAGVLGSLYYAGVCKHKGSQIAVFTMGVTGTILAAYTASNAVDNVLVEKCGMGTDFD